MNLKNIISVSGLPGLYRLVSSKNTGLLLADLDTGKTRFCSLRQHQFTPLETVAIYTEDDTTDLKTVFADIIKNKDINPIPNLNASHDELKKYFEIIIPNYDRDRVYHSDMKKLIKWYNYLQERGYLISSNDDENESKTEDSEE